MLNNVFCLEDYNVRAGEGPSDKIIKYVHIPSLDATNNVFNVPFAPGTKVAVIPIPTYTVDANGQLDLGPNPEQASTDEGGYLILADGYTLQGGSEG